MINERNDSLNKIFDWKFPKERLARVYQFVIYRISSSGVDVLTFDGINVGTTWSQLEKDSIRGFELDRIEPAINITANV